jgi:20S proteasome alpha/beta subunit
MPPKPPALLKPNPLWLPRNERVTIIAGFQCADGVMMCADTQETIMEITKCDTRKMRILGWPKPYALCGGAGDGDLVEFSMDLLERDLGSCSTLAEADEFLNRTASRVFSKHVRAYAGFPKEFIPWVSLLVAVRLQDETRLFKWSHNVARLIPKEQHVTIGWGDIQAVPLLREHNFSLAAEDMFFFAVRIMHKVKQLVPGCGGKTQAFVLKNDGSLAWWTTESIEKIERLADELDICLMNFMYFVSSKKQPDERQMKKVLEELKQFRERYLRS